MAAKKKAKSAKKGEKKSTRSSKKWSFFSYLIMEAQWGHQRASLILFIIPPYWLWYLFVRHCLYVELLTLFIKFDFTNHCPLKIGYSCFSAKTDQFFNQSFSFLMTVWKPQKENTWLDEPVEQFRNLVCRDFDLLDRYPKTSVTLYRNSPKWTLINCDVHKLTYPNKIFIVRSRVC